MTKAYTIKDFYNYYLSYISDNPLYHIDYKTYRNILTDYFKFVRDEIIEEGKEFKMPCRLGTLFIIKHKPKQWNKRSLRIDYYTSKMYNKMLFHLNEHSDGYKYRFYWSKLKSLIPNKIKYQLVVTRHNKRRLCEIIKNKQRDYVEL